MKPGLLSFHFLTIFKILFLLVWLSVQSHQQVTGTGSQTILTLIVPVFNFYKGARAKLKADFQFNVQKWPVPESVGAPWQRSLALILSLTLMRVAGSHLQVRLQVPLNLERRGAMVDDFPDMLQSLTSFSSYSSVVQVGTLLNFINQCRSITLNRFSLNMVKGHYVQLRCCTLVFCKFRQSNNGCYGSSSHYPEGGG